ncbi:MAG TPA: hypothetical protein VLA97_01650 [Nocardioidaceae bacterium]|nr:hypothetical protein [Nocardioidaceae bacterium]
MVGAARTAVRAVSAPRLPLAAIIRPEQPTRKGDNMARSHASTADDTFDTDDAGSAGRSGRAGGRRRRGRSVRALSRLTVALLFLVAIGSSYGWYQERQWNPDSPVDEGCTIQGDYLITVSFVQGPGEIASVRVTSEPDRVVVGVRTESVHDDDSAEIGSTATYSTTLGSGLNGRPILNPDGSVLPCRVVP